jgi:hypothetical protein
VVTMTNAFLKPRIKVGREFVNKAQTKEQVHSFADFIPNYVLALTVVNLFVSSE